MEIDVVCPYCGEPTIVTPDEQGGRSVEDCVVCCRPIDVHVSYDDRKEPVVDVSRQDA